MVGPCAACIQAASRRGCGNSHCDIERSPCKIPMQDSLSCEPQVDLKHEGESDEVIYQYTGEGSPTPNKCVHAC